MLGWGEKCNSRDVGDFVHISLTEHMLWAGGGGSEMEARTWLIPHVDNFYKLFRGRGLLHPGPDVLRHTPMMQHIP